MGDVAEVCCSCAGACSLRADGCASTSGGIVPQQLRTVGTAEGRGGSNESDEGYRQRFLEFDRSRYLVLSQFMLKIRSSDVRCAMDLGWPFWEPLLPISGLATQLSVPFLPNH